MNKPKRHDGVFDPITEFQEALDHVAGYMWEPGPGFSQEEIEALRFRRPTRKAAVCNPEPVPSCAGTRMVAETVEEKEIER